MSTSVEDGWRESSRRLLPRGARRVGRARLLDQLVRLEEQRLRDREFECLRGLEVDHQLELCGLLHREIGGLGALEDFVDEGRCSPQTSTMSVP